MLRKSLLQTIYMVMCLTVNSQTLPQIVETAKDGYFPFCTNGQVAPIYTDAEDYAVVGITAKMFADDVERVTGQLPETRKVSSHHALPRHAAVVAGTIGQSCLIDWLVEKGIVNISDIKGKWESFIITTVQHPISYTPLGCHGERPPRNSLRTDITQ